MQLDAAAAAAAFDWPDVCSVVRRGADVCPATTDSAAAADPAAVFRAVIRRLRRLRRCQPRSDVHGNSVGRRSAGHVAHRRARRSAVHNDGNNVEHVGTGTDRQQSDLHGSRHVVCYFDERHSQLVE